MRDIINQLREQLIQLDIVEMAGSLLAAIGLSIVLRWFYITYGRTNSNRKILADSFVLLTASVTMIIFMIKSSVALSLGLVGALSIVRFRAAIKEPEELVYLFFAIAIGLGFGAGQKLATLTAFCIILPIVYLKHRFFNVRMTESNMFLSFKLSSQSPAKMDFLEGWSNVVQKNSQKNELRRFDKHLGQLSATFLVEMKGLNSLQKIKDEVLAFHPETEFIVIDNTKPLVNL